MIVTLSPTDIHRAEYEGRKRAKWAKDSGAKDRFVCKPEDVLRQHVSGASGELAVAIVLRLDWSAPINQFGPDVGEFQVRTRPFSKKPGRHDLAIKPIDNDWQRFILVIDQSPTFEICGWAYGREAKKPRWRIPKGKFAGMYFHPNNLLRDIEWLLINR